MAKHNKSETEAEISTTNDVIENLQQLAYLQEETSVSSNPAQHEVTSEQPLEVVGNIALAPEVIVEAPQHRVDEEAFAKATNTSERMRELSRQGFKTSAIAKIMEARFGAGRKHPFRYQHVRNVLSQPLKRKVS